jgi:hypothetical protein
MMSGESSLEGYGLPKGFSTLIREVNCKASFPMYGWRRAILGVANF